MSQVKRNKISVILHTILFLFAITLSIGKNIYNYPSYLFISKYLCMQISKRNEYALKDTFTKYNLNDMVFIISKCLEGDVIMRKIFLEIKVKLLVNIFVLC